MHASPEEIQAWKEPDRAGVTLEAQWLPDQPKTRLNAVIRGVG
ncbi:MAG: hypothetical protein ACOY94_05755 [Bacillota bacterium]